MIDPRFMIVYVEDPLRSAAFYEGLLGRKPVEAKSTFSMFALDSGMMLGLWSKRTVEPAASVTGGGGELAFPVLDNAAVDALYADWSRRGYAIAQHPTKMDFGYAFTALDPDGHRLRVFAPAPRGADDPSDG